MNDSPSDLDLRIDRYSRGEVTGPEARHLAQEALDSAELLDELTSVALVKRTLQSLPSASEEELARYVGGRLAPSEERRLAQVALDREEVFDALAAHGAIERSLQDETFRAKISQPGARARRFSRTTSAVAIGSIAAATVLAVYFIRDSKTAAPPVSTHSAITTTAPTPRPSLGGSASPEQPILLATLLDPVRPAAGVVFRGTAPHSRPPRPDGTILALEQGIATINLGSVDGLAKGSELRVFRDGTSSQPVGRLIVTAVFREQSRGRIVAGETVRERDLVRPNNSVYLRALFEQAEAQRDRGDLPGARDAARRALSWADSEKIARGEKRNLMVFLASLEFQTGETTAALEHLHAAADSFTAAPAPTALEQAGIENSLGALYLARGDFTRAEQSLDAAAKIDTGASLEAQIRNNRGVLSELRGDSLRAVAAYGEALKAIERDRLSSASERRAIEANLARVKRPN
jgi:hypothetical protein